MELLSVFDLPVTITGDINIHFQTVDETNTKRMNEILESFGLVQHVSEPTHGRGGILDVVITSIDQPPTAVSVDDVGISDHMLLTWPVKLAQPSPVYVTTSRRNWRDFDFELFVRQLESLNCVILLSLPSVRIAWPKDSMSSLWTFSTG